MEKIKVRALQGMAARGDLWRKGEEREVSTAEAVRLLNARMVEKVEDAQVEQAVKPVARGRKRKSD